MDNRKKEIGASIKAARTVAGISQQDMAKRACVSANTVSNWELGVSTFDIDKAWDMADALGVSIDEMVGRK